MVYVASGSASLHLAWPDCGSLRAAHLWVVPRRDVREHQSAHSPCVEGGPGGPAAGEVDAHGGITAVDEGSVGKHEVGAREQRRQGRAGVGVAAVGQHAAGSLDAEAVRLDRVVDPERRHGERAEGERLLLDERGEDELARHAAVVETVVRERQPLLRPGRRVDRQGAGQGALRAVLPRHVEPEEVDAVVRVQMGDEHGIEVRGVEVALQGPQRAAAEVEQQVVVAAVVLGPHQVGRGGRVRAGEGPGAPDDGEPHRAPTSPVTASGAPASTAAGRAATASGPRKRRASRANSSGSPVVSHSCSGSGRSGRSASASARSRKTSLAVSSALETRVTPSPMT